MDKEHIKGAAKKVEGAAKEALGKVIGDRSLELKGKADKIEGEMHDTIGDAKDAAEKAAKGIGKAVDDAKG